MKLYHLLLFLFCLQFVKAQYNHQRIEMTPSSWSIPDGAFFERFDGRETLVLESGRATLKQKLFSNGTIEVDVYNNSKRSFAGISFREADGNLDEVYLRMHKSNQVDAVQYTPLFNKESNWQLYGNYQATASFREDGWNALRVEVRDHTAEIFVNNIKVRTIDRLRSENHEGKLGLWALFGNRFSNFRVTFKGTYGATEVTKEVPMQSNIIGKWDITDAFPYNGGHIDAQIFPNLDYISVATEQSGLLPISRYVRKNSSGGFEGNKEDYIVARTKINTYSEETKVFYFDYSDRIMVFLNGVLLFSGNNAFRQKGVQYMGHLEIHTNALYLPLQKGINEIHCVVIDKANGWGLMGKLE